MDEDLISRAARGDGDAIGQLYDAHAARVYTIVRRIAGDDGVAEDWAQDAWLRILRGLSRFRGEADVGTWVHRIALNTALDGVRRAPRLAMVDEEVGRGRAAPEGEPLLRMTLEEAIDGLPAGMRRVLVLHDIEGYTHDEIGEMLGLSAGTSKSQLYKARARLRERLSADREVEQGRTRCYT